ncbi:MAG: tetratricopeptide repeat protein [Pseudomonadales bacterium]|nr:tetratricopeptide repeat protein [Pseudomonadales bacterium]
MNKTLSAVVSKIQVGILASIFAAAATAQMGGTVVESQGFTPGQQNQATTLPSSNNDALSLLLDQNQQLRSELQALRALIEEQGFEIRKLQRDSLSRYTNVDDRLSAIETSGDDLSPTTTSRVIEPAINNTASSDSTLSRSAVGSAPETLAVGISPDSIRSSPNNNPAIATPRNTNRSSGRATLQPAVLSEQQLYQMAYDSVINSNFERSIAEFDQYLNIYPEGRFLTNAHYWKGQAYLYLNRFNEAKDSYEIILNQHEDSAKLPDAMYGLALAYQGLGNIPQARQLLNDIKRRFENTGVANLADTRLLQLD